MIANSCVYILALPLWTCRGGEPDLLMATQYLWFYVVVIMVLTVYVELPDILKALREQN